MDSETVYETRLRTRFEFFKFPAENLSSFHRLIPTARDAQVSEQLISIVFPKSRPAPKWAQGQVGAQQRVGA